MFPVAMRVNTRFVSQTGFALRGAYSVRENFALTVSTTQFVHASENGFTRELVNKARVQPFGPTPSLLRSALMVGVELTPVHGGYALSEKYSGNLALVISAAAGFGRTEIEVRPGLQQDTGVVPVREVGLGARLDVGTRVRVRLEMRDSMYTARLVVPPSGGLPISPRSPLTSVVQTDVISVLGVYAGIGIVF